MPRHALHAIIGSMALLPACASASTVLYDDFSADTPALAVTSLPNFTVTGNIDVVGARNPYGISTTKNVIDLDGSPGPGGLNSNPFNFAANDRVKLTFVLGGAQRGSASDDFEAGFLFSFGSIETNYTLSGGYGSINQGTVVFPFQSTLKFIPGTSPFTTYIISFTTQTAGSLRTQIMTFSQDGVGPLLSSERLEIGSVPEPTSWVLMIAGFGLIGLFARRRSRVVAA